MEEYFDPQILAPPLEVRAPKKKSSLTVEIRLPKSQERQKERYCQTCGKPILTISKKRSYNCPACRKHSRNWKLKAVRKGAGARKRGPVSCALPWVPFFACFLLALVGLLPGRMAAQFLVLGAISTLVLGAKPWSTEIDWCEDIRNWNPGKA